MKVQLDLSKHCIETELKRLYNRSVSQYFKLKEEKDSLEELIEHLQQALTGLDFPLLRSRFPELAGDTDKDIFLLTENNDQIHVYVNGKKISW